MLSCGCSRWLLELACGLTCAEAPVHCRHPSHQDAGAVLDLKVDLGRLGHPEAVGTFVGGLCVVLQPMDVSVRRPRRAAGFAQAAGCRAAHRLTCASDSICIVFRLAPVREFLTGQSAVCKSKAAGCLKLLTSNQGVRAYHPPPRAPPSTSSCSSTALTSLAAGDARNTSASCV